MKCCYEARFPFLKPSQKSRSVLSDRARFFKLFGEGCKNPSYNRRNAVPTSYFWYSLQIFTTKDVESLSSELSCWKEPAEQKDWVVIIHGHYFVILPLCPIFQWYNTKRKSMPPKGYMCKQNTWNSHWYTVKILCIGTDRSQQTVQTKIRLLLKKQSDQGLHCLPLHQLLLDALMQCYIKLYQFYHNYGNCLRCPKF